MEMETMVHPDQGAPGHNRVTTASLHPSKSRRSPPTMAVAHDPTQAALTALLPAHVRLQPTLPLFINILI